MTDNANWIDLARSACLCDVGSAGYLLAVVIGPDGAEYVQLAEKESIGNPAVGCDPTCSAIAHEQTGPLPLEFVRRITISRRTNRCGRPTAAGGRCRIPVTRPGDACVWHKTQRTSERNHS
jgi:hypothetical protein